MQKIGIIVGRFQVAELHEGHKKLIETAIHDMDTVLLFLGVTKDEAINLRNPLPYEARRDMILESFPQLLNQIYKIYDIGNWDLWVKSLDDNILNLIDNDSDVYIIGSRDSVATRYKEHNGKFSIYLVDEVEGKSGTLARKELSDKLEPKWTKEMREHFIWLLNNKKINNVDTI